MKLRRSNAFFVVAVVVALTPACSSSSNGATTDGGIAADGGGDGATDVRLGFTPSNIDLRGFDLSKAGDVVASGAGCLIDTEGTSPSGGILCADKPDNIVHQIVTDASGARLSVFIMKSLRVEASTVITTRGHIPLIVIALETMDLYGSFDINPGTAGGSYDAMMDTTGSGPGGGPAGDTTGLAGGGASYCGLGGKGGTNSALGGSAPKAATGAFGTPEIVPLVGGSAGGMGAVAGGAGSGGGALQLVAGSAFTLKTGAFVNVGGGGGPFGGLGKDGAGGGGSGGSLLIESKQVTIEGQLSANGGGGGQGNGDTGEDGHPDRVALGGHKAMEGAPAGNGSFGATLDGSDGPSSSDMVISAGSGGGGAGRIRINTSSGQATISGVLSPPTTSACATQGTVKP